jgi:hypothetical protein
VKRGSLGSWVLGLGVAGSLLLAVPALAKTEVHATLAPAVIGIDETATFSLEVSGDSFSSLRFHPNFELDNLEILGGPSQYEDMQFVNGSFSRTFRLSWQVRPLGLGEARVRSISVQLNDETVQLPPQAIQVQREPARPPQPSLGGGEEDDPFQQFFGRFPNPFRRQSRQPEVYLRAEIQPQQPVVGQQVLYTLYLYTREDIAAISPSGVPTFRGFWVQDVQLPQQLPTEMVEVDGRRFGRVPLLRKALFPLRPGRYNVEPAMIDLTVQRYDRSFFGPPIAHPEPLRLRTEGQWIDVQPLPPAPPGFGGAVGQLTLTAELQPARIHLGEAATLTVRLAGAGNLQGIREPGIAPPPGVTVFPPQQEAKEEISGTTLRGSRTWRYVVVPDRAGRFRLEVPEIPYFDPAARRYALAAAPDLALTALPRSTDVAAAAGGETLHGIRTAALAPPGLPEMTGRRWTGLLPWLFVLPWGLALVVTLARRRAGAGKPPAASSAGRELAAGLAEAEREERPRQAAARTEEAWRDFLAERWDVPAAAPPSHWRDLLAARGVDVESLEEVGRLVEDLQYLRNAPQLSATGNLRQETLRRCRRLLRRLQ